METQSNDESRSYTEAYMRRARAAQASFENATQEDADRAVRAIAKVVYDNAEALAALAVEDTHMGNVRDKTAKNRSKARLIWNSLKGKKSRGILERDEASGITTVAKPLGVVAAITPCTNPIVTPMSNSMFALKCGNAIIITPHHSATLCSAQAVALFRAELKKLGFPEDLVQILDRHSREHTKNLIAMADVTIATGGAGLVRAAYSSGKPALGVGAGNVQAIIDRGADYAEAVRLIAEGRAFDNGIICSGEQSAICPEEDFETILRSFEACGCYVIESPAEREALRSALFEDGEMSRHAVGQSAAAVARLAGIETDENIKAIAVEAEGTGRNDVLAKEKMCPVIALYRYRDFAEAIAVAKANLEAEGKGHSVAIHSDNREHIEYAGRALPVSRFLINQICASSAGGSFQNGLAPTNTMGCGSWGNNSLSENLSYRHLMNVSRIAYNMPNNPVPSDEELWAEI
ncbi:MAG: aldehyde dehydrogenase family protein [Clostridiales Family XIII bacterium]|jgi:succinate-semialdehyde dehydrogenase|nr:aldehyde dehydrogenase family protein [Clostridiales Family XIII bacterium]